MFIKYDDLEVDFILKCFQRDRLCVDKDKSGYNFFVFLFQRSVFVVFYWNKGRKFNEMCVVIISL